jgi:hypothetical protein
MAHSIGDPNHIGVHNELASDVQTAATEMGVDVDLPPQRILGDTGHVDDHNLIQAALDKIAAEGSAGASWAQVISAPDAVTSSYYDDKGGQWAYYEWNAAGSFSVELSGGLVWVLAVGGGAYGNTSQVAYNEGQPGLVNEGLWQFGPGTHTVTVGERGTTYASSGKSSGEPSSIGDYGTQGKSSWGSSGTGRGLTGGYLSRITGDESEYATPYTGADVPGRASYQGTNRDGCVIIAVRIDVPTLPPAPPRLEVAPVVAKPVSITGPEVQEWLVKDKQNNRKVVYFLPGNTGTARSLALTEEGAEALQARRELLDAIATTEVPEDFDGDPVTLLPKKLRGELTGFVEVRAVPQPEAVYSVTLGAGVLPGVMVAAGGTGGADGSSQVGGGGGGAGGVIGTGANVPVILPGQGTTTYTITVASTTGQITDLNSGAAMPIAQDTTIAVQGQAPFAAAIGGGRGFCRHNNGSNIQPGIGGSGGGGGSGFPVTKSVPGQGFPGGNMTTTNGAGGGGYSGNVTDSSVGTGGPGLDLAAALNLDANDGMTGSFLNQVSVNGRIAGGGGGVGTDGTAGIDGGGTYNPNSPGTNAMDFTGAGGGGTNAQKSGTGGAGAVYIITDPT